MSAIIKSDTSYTKNYREVREIFGKNVQLECYDAELVPIISDELSLYPEGNNNDGQNEKYILEILSQESFLDRLKEFDRRDYIEITDEISNRCFIFEDGNLSRVLFTLHKPVNALHGWIQRFRNMGYNRREERVGQIIHEHVLVPSVIFDNNVIPVHSSAVEYNNKVILFGGHGGVGKTSLELELCFHKKAHFIADDISVMSKSGRIYPNLSYPKIYGYNVEGEPQISDAIKAGFGMMEHLHWKLHAMKGLNKVRRRISPAEFYENYKNKDVKGDRYMILKRYSGKKIKREKINATKAAEMSVDILKLEFSKMLERLDKPESPHLQTFRKETILNRWIQDLEMALSSIDCEIIHIPEGIEHNTFKKELLEIFA